ncbi:MAG: HAD family hydrolase [Caldilineales bacterium]
MNLQNPIESVPESRQPAQATRRGVFRGRSIAAVLFDLDGTLVETDDQAVAQLARRLDRVRRFVPGGDTTRAARRLIMHNHDFLNRWLVLLDQIGVDGPVIRLAKRWGLLDDRSNGASLVPVAGTVELVMRLSKQYKLAIVSTRGEADLRAYLDCQGLNECFQAVVGSDSTRRIKPHPEPVLRALDLLNVTARQAVMVGDTTVDIAAARAAGVLSVGVLCGFGEERDFGGAELVLHSTGELADWL